MDDSQRTAEIARLQGELFDAVARYDRLFAEIKTLPDWIGAVRKAFGNPFFYSGGSNPPPEHGDKSADKYTGYSSHKVVLQLASPAIRRFLEVSREVQTIRGRLQRLGVSVK